MAIPSLNLKNDPVAINFASKNFKMDSVLAEINNSPSKRAPSDLGIKKEKYSFNRFF